MLPAPLFAVVSIVTGPIGDGFRPASKNMVVRNESEAAAGVGVGVAVGVGDAVGVGVGVPGMLLETDPQPTSNNKNPEKKTTIALRRESLLDLQCVGQKGN
jgi:hypothetical protein